ncbi:RNF4 [Sanghuangporus weigelae]
MGQINSLSCQCSYHSLRTRHSEEGYCTLCQERFSSLRGRDIPNEESDDLKKKVFTSKELNSNENSRGFSDRTQSLPQTRFYLPEPDLIYKCEQCQRFFYSLKQLSEHTEFPQTGHAFRNARFSEVGGPVPDKIFRDLSVCRMFDRLDASLSHLQRPEISKKDLETERQHVCCVRCGIYFVSREQKRKHFRDVEDYIMHVEAKDNTTWDDAISTNREDPVDLMCPSAALFPPPPSMIHTSSPTRPSSASRIHATSPLPDPLPGFPAFVSHSSPYIPELRAGFCKMQQLPPLTYRFGTSFPHSNLGSSSSGPIAKTIVRVPDDFECSLCLENEKDVSSLPCGHIFGTACIYKTLDSDPRCPLCRRPAERYSVKRLQSA